MSDIDKARLESCIENIKDTLGDRFSRQQLVSAVLQHNFKIEDAITELLENQASEQQKNVGKVEKGEVSNSFMKYVMKFKICILI